MSGSIFGNVPQVQVPDFGATMARAQGMQANRLAMLAQQRQMEEADQRQQFFAQNAPGFASADPAKRMNLLAMLGAVPGGAAMALPMMDQERRRAELRDIMSDGMPSAAPVVQPAPQGGYIDRLVQDESGGRPDARNPRSSATGAAQFIDSTWLQFAQANPQLFQGMSREQVLAARSDPNLSRQAAEWYRRENIGALSGQGLPANDGTAALAHRFGPQGAAALLRADQNAPIAGVVGPQVMAANPDLNGRTVGQVVGRYAQRFGGDTIPAQTGAATPAAASGNDQRIAILQRRAERLMAAGYQQEAQSTLALIQSLRRGEAEPLEVVEGPNGQPELVPRSQAAGRRPASRETAPRSAERFEQDRALAEAGASRSTTTVNAGDRRTDVLIADAWKASEDTAVAAGRRAALLGRAEQAFERFQPGALAEPRIWLGQIARELGIRTPGTSEGEVLQQVQRQLELATTPQGQGAITENERGLIRQAIPVLLSTPEGARQAIALIRRLDDYEMQIARIYRENARRHGGQPNAVSVREEIADFVSRNQPPDVQAVIENLSGPVRGGGGGVQADPPAGANAAPVRVRTPEEARRLPSGTPIILPDGSQGRVP